MAKGGEQPTVSTYKTGVHFVLCHGPVDSINQIRVDDRKAWGGENTGGTIVIDAPELFGGMTREGGITGKVDIAMGLPTQGVNAYLDSKIAGDIPAFRGVVSAILRNVYVGLNYYFKPWAFRATRIHVLKNGTPQWQDGLAEFTSAPYSNPFEGTVIALDHLGSQAYLATDIAHTLQAGDLITVQGATGGNATYYNGVFVVSAVDLQPTIFTYTMTGTPTAAAVGTILLSKGTIKPGTKLINAVHVVRECLTDTTWGLGYPIGLIHEASFLAAAQKCFDEGLGFAWFWNKDSTIQDFINEVLTHIQGSLYLDRRDGLFHLSLVRYITNTAPLITLDITNTLEVSDFTRKSVGELISEVSVKFINNATNKEDSVTVSDSALSQRQGTSISKIMNYSGVASSDVAHKLAVRDLRQMSRSLYTCTIKCDRTAEFLNIGDAFTLDWPDYVPTPLVMRVLSINLGTATKQAITIDCIQDIFYASTVVYQIPPTSGWIDPVTYPTPVALRLLNELPYYLLAVTKGDTFAQGVATTTGYIAIAGVSPSDDSISAGIWSTTGTDFIKKGSMDFCFTGLLVADINKTDTSIIVTGEIDLELLTVNHFIQIEGELLGVTAIVDNTLTVIRGVLDTVPASHLANSRMYGWHDFFDSDQVGYLIGEIPKVKLTPTTPKGELAVTSAPYDTVSITGRMHKPYPPGNFKVNGAYWPASVVTSDLTLTWTSRNRFQQTTGLIDYYTGSITTEEGVSYSGVLTRVDTGATLLSFASEGSLTKVLDTFVNLPGAVTSITRVGTLATVTMDTAHGKATGNKVVISGSTDVIYNGTYDITSTGANTFTYVMASAPAASPATGTLVARGSIYSGDVKIEVWSVNANGSSWQRVSHIFTLS